LVIAAGVALLALTHTAPFPMFLDLSKTSTWRVDTGGRKIVYLTFDDGPNLRFTPQLLDLLRDTRVPGTFFLIPEHVTPETASIVRRMAAEGHGIGHHSKHRWLMLRQPAEITARLTTEAGQIKELTGTRPCPVFRPHAGFRSWSLIRGLKRAGYQLAGWSWMSWDWYWFKERTGERVARQIVSHAKPGSIIVIHDSHHKTRDADRQYAIDATRLIIEKLRGQGFEFGNLCEALAQP
jgi:peptidoglycan/xylan/chitin deacetylase (PgdA/CDA1 family)